MTERGQVDILDALEIEAAAPGPENHLPESQVIVGLQGAGNQLAGPDQGVGRTAETHLRRQVRQQGKTQLTPRTLVTGPVNGQGLEQETVLAESGDVRCGEAVLKGSLGQGFSQFTVDEKVEIGQIAAVRDQGRYLLAAAFLDGGAGRRRQ